MNTRLKRYVAGRGTGNHIELQNLGGVSLYLTLIRPASNPEEGILLNWDQVGDLIDTLTDMRKDI